MEVENGLVEDHFPPHDTHGRRSIDTHPLVRNRGGVSVSGTSCRTRRSIGLLSQQMPARSPMPDDRPSSGFTCPINRHPTLFQGLLPCELPEKSEKAAPKKTRPAPVSSWWIWAKTSLAANSSTKVTTSAPVPLDEATHEEEHEKKAPPCRRRSRHEDATNGAPGVTTRSNVRY